MLDTTALASPDLKGMFCFEVERYVTADGTLNAFYSITPPRRAGAGVIFELWLSSATSTYVSAKYRVKRRKGKKAAFDVAWFAKGNRAVPVTTGDTHAQIVSIAAQIEKMGRF